MLSVRVRPHRGYLRAQGGVQKLFVMLKMLPSPEASRRRPHVDLALVIDTSGSMREPAPGAAPGLAGTPLVTAGGKTYHATHHGTSKLDVAVEAARRLLNSSQLQPEDRLAVIQFDDASQVLASGQVGADRVRFQSAIERLAGFSGGTQMALGLARAVDVLSDHGDAARTVLLLTDGLAADEKECRRAAERLTQLQARIVALGVGEEYNEDLLADLCSVTRGTPYDFRDMTALPDIFEQELGSAARQVVSDVQLTVKLVRDVRLVSATRMYPTLAELDPSQVTLQLGSLEAGDHTVFILELDVPERPPIQARLAQFGVTYWIPADGYRGEVPPLDLPVEFTTDETLAASVDSEVMGYVQQRNIDHLVRQAADQAHANPEQARKTLQVARSMTQRLGNRGMTVALSQAEDELRSNRTISAGTRKTIKLGARTHTMKVGGPDDQVVENIPPEEEIRRLTGA